MRPAQVGIFLGAILGFALVVEGFGEMLVVGLAALVGWVIGMALSGELDTSGSRGRASTDTWSSRRP